MLTGLDCSSKALAEFPATAYKAATQFPAAAPPIYAIMSVIVPAFVDTKYETDWALASFWSK